LHPLTQDALVLGQDSPPGLQQLINRSLGMVPVDGQSRCFDFDPMRQLVRILSALPVLKERKRGRAEAILYL